MAFVPHAYYMGCGIGLLGGALLGGLLSYSLFAPGDVGAAAGGLTVGGMLGMGAGTLVMHIHYKTDEWRERRGEKKAEAPSAGEEGP